MPRPVMTSPHRHKLTRDGSVRAGIDATIQRSNMHARCHTSGWCYRAEGVPHGDTCVFLFSARVTPSPAPDHLEESEKPNIPFPGRPEGAQAPSGLSLSGSGTHPARERPQEPRMKFGMFYEHQLPRPWGEGDELRLFQDALEQVELADRLGFDSPRGGEDHFLEEDSHS